MKTHELRPDGRPFDREMLARALSVVVEHVAEIENIHAAVRHVCGHHQESVDAARLDTPDFNADPIKARIHAAYLAGVSEGIETTCNHLTDSSTIREFRHWLGEEESEKED